MHDKGNTEGFHIAVGKCTGLFWKNRYLTLLKEFFNERAMTQ